MYQGHQPAWLNKHLQHNKQVDNKQLNKVLQHNKGLDNKWNRRRKWIQVCPLSTGALPILGRSSHQCNGYTNEQIRGYLDSNHYQYDHQLLYNKVDMNSRHR